MFRMWHRAYQVCRKVQQDHRDTKQSSLSESRRIYMMRIEHPWNNTKHETSLTSYCIMTRELHCRAMRTRYEWIPSKFFVKTFLMTIMPRMMELRQATINISTITRSRTFHTCKLSTVRMYRQICGGRRDRGWHGPPHDFGYLAQKSGQHLISPLPPIQYACLHRQS